MEHILTTWLLTYAVHSAMFTVLAFVAERTRWGAVASRRDAFWTLALLGGVVTSTLFVVAGSAPSGAAVRLSPQGAIAPALDNDGVFWLTTAWMAITALLALRAGRAWRLGIRRVGRRRVIRRGPAPALLREILGLAADRVTLSCSRTLLPVAFAREICVPVRALRELPHDELRALLAHEAAHVVRRDAAWLAIAAAVRAVGWWQPLNIVAAARLRLAMELCCDERAGAEPHERAALARCLITVAEWSVEECPGFAAMASRGSALRRRVETLLDDAPRRHRRKRPWLAVTSVAVPAVCLAPVATTADLSRVPAAAAEVVRHGQVPEGTEALVRGVVPAPGRANLRPARRSSKPAAAAPPIAAATDQTAVPEIAVDKPPAAPPESMLAGPDLEPEAAPALPSTRLRDAIAAARITPEPAPRMRLDVPARERSALSRIAQRIGFDTTRPKLDVPDPVRVALSRAQQIAFDATRQK
jgi:Zn-dependent protease with chaperone function